MKVHPITACYPMMNDEEMAELVADVKERGLVYPVTIQGDILLDGRNRALACERAGVAIKTVEYKGNDPVGFILSTNKRRNLDASQRAVVAARIANLEGPGRPEKNAPNGAISQDDAADAIGVSRRSVQRAAAVLNADPDLAEKVVQGELSVAKAEQIVRETARPDAKELPRKPNEKPTFNRTNENIDWAWWSWNPVTGCKHGCPYCYAKDIAMRFSGHFKPEFHSERLTAPQNTKPANDPVIGARCVFVCSMADLFGAWVPDKWIEAVLDEVRKSPQWIFIFLTKNPTRLVDIEWPDNAWVGITVDTQARVRPAIEAFKKIKATVRFVSCEPFLEKLSFPSMPFDWILIGAQSQTSGAPAFQPEWIWVHDLESQARSNDVAVFMKPNLTVRAKEYPNLEAR